MLRLGIVQLTWISVITLGLVSNQKRFHRTYNGLLMSTEPKIELFPFYGFTWNFYSKWVSDSLKGNTVNDEMRSIWSNYGAPLHMNHIRFNIQVVKYKDNPRTFEEFQENRSLVNRLINLCRFAEMNSLHLFPVLMGIRRNREHLDNFPAMVYGYIRDFLRTLRDQGETRLYNRIGSFQIENEMGHPIRHMFWLGDSVVNAIREACELIRLAEMEEQANRCVPLTINYSFDLLFKKRFLRSPFDDLRAFFDHRLPDFSIPPDLRVFIEHPDVDLIGVDFFPESWSPFASRSMLLELVRTLCDRYGIRSPFKKRILVAETGFTNLVRRWRGNQGQVEYYRAVLSQLSDYYWNGEGREKGFGGLLWYCLSDTKIRYFDGAGAFTPGEYRFGVLRTIPPNSYCSYPAIPKATWHWLRDHTVPSTSSYDAVATAGDSSDA